MNALRPMIAATTSLAMIVNTALGQPCWCAAPMDHEHTCCKSASRDVVRHVCCVKQTTNCGVCSFGERSTCVNSDPASVAKREDASADVRSEELPSVLWCGLQATAEKIGVASFRSEHCRVLSGPALLAMYCLWLN